MSNRQLVIIGSFALACCVILAVAMHKPAPEPLKIDEPTTVGRYQVLSVPQPTDGSLIVVLDTATGLTWHVRLPSESKEVEKWKALGSPGATKQAPLTATAM
jgi:hypothetical protein